MAPAPVEDIEVGIEEAVSKLPSNVLDEAIPETNNKKKKGDVKYHNHRHRSKLPIEPFPPSKACPRRNQKQKHSPNWVTGGPGMQAFFLDSGRKSCGTGVFLPQSSKRPACSPVLFPCRLVQTLNLNVNELGLQIIPRRDPKNNTTTRGEGSDPSNNKIGKDNASTTKRCVNVITQNENSSPDVFLPDEWTY